MFAISFSPSTIIIPKHSLLLLYWARAHPRLFFLRPSCTHHSNVLLITHCPPLRSLPPLRPPSLSVVGVTATDQRPTLRTKLEWKHGKFPSISHEPSCPPIYQMLMYPDLHLIDDTSSDDSKSKKKSKSNKSKSQKSISSKSGTKHLKSEMSLHKDNGHQDDITGNWKTPRW